MIKAADLRAQTRKELAELAKNYGVPGYHSLRKDDLVTEICKVQRRLRRKANATEQKKSKSSRSKVTASVVKPKKKSASVSSAVTKGKAKPASKSPRMAASRPRAASEGTKRSQAMMAKQEEQERVSAKTARIRAQLRRRRETAQRHRDLSTAMLVGGAAVKNGTSRQRSQEAHRDRVALLVRDAFWLQATWEITRTSISRAESSLAERWHTAKPMLRLLSVGDSSSNQAESVLRDIPIHGGVNNWYIDVDEPPSRFRVLVGYLTDNGEFYTLCRSNIVETPRPNACERLDEHWNDIAEDYERIYSLSGGYEQDAGDLKAVFEDRLHRKMPHRNENGQTVGDASLLRQVKLPFKVEAELIVFGKTVPTGNVSIGGRPVKLQDDGSFTVRMEMPDRRQVLPVTVESRDGLRQRTTVIAVERNTKVMETVELDEKI